MKTALRAVMFTDLLGFTERTSRQTRRENERLVRLHDGLLSPVIRGYRGWRVKSLGDAYLVVFDSATRAIACGAAIQDRLAAFNQRASEADRLHVRVAISAGELRLQGGDVFGEAVNVASRLLGVTGPGEICFTEAALLLADLSGLTYEDLGPHDFRGVPEPVRVFRLARGDDEAPYGHRFPEALEPGPSKWFSPWARRGRAR